MSTLDWARTQFAVTTLFHFIFMPMSIGMALFVAVCQTRRHESALRCALGAVELDAWVRHLPHRLDTPVGQYGERVSGGRRQRLALARALLAPARILIRDEPTAHLDAPLAAVFSLGYSPPPLGTACYSSPTTPPQ